MFRAGAVLAVLFFAASAHAQQIPNGNTALRYGYVWSPIQWTLAWQSKADVANGTLTTPTISGPIVTGGTFTGGMLNGTTDSNSVTVNLNGAVSGIQGTNFSGADITSALQAQINAVEANPQGGIVQLPCGGGVISQTILVDASNVHLRACGIGIDWTGTTTVQGGTELRWNGASGGTMVRFAPQSGASTPLYDSDAQGIILNGQNVAAVGWDVQSVRNGTWQMGFAHLTADGVILETANVSGSPSLQGNDFSIFGDVRDGSATAVLARDTNTPGTANVSLNLFRRIDVLTNTGWGLQLIDTDNNQFDLVDIYSLQGASSDGIDLQAPHAAGSDTFRYVNTNGGAIDVETGYAQAWFYLLDAGNATPQPTLSGTGTAYWQTNSINRSLTPNMSSNCGTGAITADIQGGGSETCRGSYAIDLQQIRQGSGQVASATGSGIIGYSNNEAENAGCYAFGYTWNLCDGNYSQVYGSFAASKERQGIFSWANAGLGSEGDSEAGLTVFGVESTTVAAYRLVEDNSATANGVNCFNIIDHATYAFSLMLVAQDVTTDGNRQSTVYPIAMLGRGSGAGSVTLSLGTPVSLTQGTTGTFGTPTADTTNGCLSIGWTAPNSDTWKAVARIVSVETGR